MVIPNKLYSRFRQWEDLEEYDVFEVFRNAHPLDDYMQDIYDQDLYDDESIP